MWERAITVKKLPFGLFASGISLAGVGRHVCLPSGSFHCPYPHSICRALLKAQWFYVDYLYENAKKELPKLNQENRHVNGENLSFFFVSLELSP